MKYELRLLGELPSHKNEKIGIMRRRKRGTVKGAAGSHYPGLATKPQVKEAIDRVALQIPGDLRDLRLEHPRMDIYLVVGRPNVDRDNIVSTLLDLLTKYGILSDDNVAHCNGSMQIYPAVLIPNQWETTVIMEV